jgi:hypothetical protein
MRNMAAQNDAGSGSCPRTVLFLLFGGAMAAVGDLGLSGVQPRARRSQQYVLSWLEQVAAARSTKSGTEG